jgi:hypothetical protein
MSYYYVCGLRFVIQFGKIQVLNTVFDREFVAGLSAQDGLLFREQRPTTQEPATSWVVAFFGDKYALYY